MTAHTAPRRTFVGSADVAPGGASPELVPQSTSDAISHPVPTPDDEWFFPSSGEALCLRCKIDEAQPHKLLCVDCEAGR